MSGGNEQFSLNCLYFQPKILAISVNAELDITGFPFGDNQQEVNVSCDCNP